MSRPLRIGTRGSPLALWQAEWVAAELRRSHPNLPVELVEIRTRGDRDRNSPLNAIGGGTGLFTKEIQRAVLEGAVDVAVHSLKDLPTSGPEGLVLGAVPPREAANDALIAPRYGTLTDLPEGSRVGTGSLRRRAMLLHERPDLEIVDIRGNVETRLARADVDLDAVVLAEAGLARLGLADRITERLGPPRFLPAVGQGALGIECRVDDKETRTLVAKLSHRATEWAARAERWVLAELEGGCMIPLGAWGRMEAGGLALDVAVYSADGQSKVEAAAVEASNDPEELGRRVASELIERGAAELLRTR